MKIKKTAALCALAFAAIGGSAHAALSSSAVTDLNDANGSSRVFFVSGASAVQKGFAAIIAKTFVASTINYYSDGAKVSGANYVGVSGTLASTAGAWAGKKGIVIYRVKGGSAYGVDPVARNAAIDSLIVTAGACGSSGNGSEATPYVCTVGTNNMVPDAGISDVAPKFFKSPVNTEGETAAESLTDDQLAELTATPIYGLAFGVPVTNTVNPNVVLTKAKIAAIMAGNVGTWDQIDSHESADDIVICRRTPGSGTQAVMNMWAGGYPCSETSNLPADRDISGAWDSAARKFTVNKGTGGVVVVENSSSGDVKKCLDAAATGTSYTTGDRDGKTVTVQFVGAGHKAIGVLSMDSLNGSTTSSNWQFRSLNGAGKYTATVDANSNVTAVSSTGTGQFPTFEAYENGDWDMQGWESFNIPSRTTGAKLDIANLFVKNAQDPAILQGINALKYVAAGIPGGDYSGDKVLDAAYLNGDQCAPYNRNFND